MAHFKLGLLIEFRPSVLQFSPESSETWARDYLYMHLNAAEVSRLESVWLLSSCRLSKSHERHISNWACWPNFARQFFNFRLNPPKLEPQPACIYILMPPKFWDLNLFGCWVVVGWVSCLNGTFQIGLVDRISPVSSSIFAWILRNLSQRLLVYAS